MVNFGTPENLLVTGNLVVAPVGEEFGFVVLERRDIGTGGEDWWGGAGLTMVIYRSPRIMITASPERALNSV